MSGVHDSLSIFLVSMCLCHAVIFSISGTDTANRNSSASSDGDDESHKLDNILGDIRSGFIQKKSFGDTAFSVTKVKKVSWIFTLFYASQTHM